MSKELVDRVMALGVGKYLGLATTMDCDPRLYHINDRPVLGSAAFTSDWRVAGALMEKLIPGVANIQFMHDGTVYVHTDWDADFAENSGGGESLPTAIIQACVEALEAK